MSTSPEPTPPPTAPVTTEGKPPRLGRLLRWAARITSVPVFVLVIVSLVPALTNFNISPKDDKIIAVALCGAALGFVLGWRWPGMGGVLVVVSVVTMLSQGDSWLYPDSFSVAFGLQGLLFVIAALANSKRNPSASPAQGWLTKAAIGLLAVLAMAGVASIVRGPGPTPVPKDKEAYVGIWKDGAGFKLEIKADGHATASQDKSSKVNPMNSPVGPGESKSFLIYFRGDDKLELSTGAIGESRMYHIDRVPHAQGKQTKMVINGSDPYQKTSGMAVVKEP